MAREEDNLSLRHIGGKIDDGFSLHIQPDGTMLALALLLSGRQVPYSGQLVFFQSVDGGLTWSSQEPVGTGMGVYACTIQARDGSMLGGKEADVMYSAPLTPPFHTVSLASVPLRLADTPQRYDYWSQGSNGTRTYVRAYTEPNTGRSYYYVYEYAASSFLSHTRILPATTTRSTSPDRTARTTTTTLMAISSAPTATGSQTVTGHGITSSSSVTHPTRCTGGTSTTMTSKGIGPRPTSTIRGTIGTLGFNTLTDFSSAMIAPASMKLTRCASRVSVEQT